MSSNTPYTSNTEMNDKETAGIDNGKIALARELFGGEIYAYYPLGQHIVAAPGVCGGRPTFKYTRLEVSVILAQLSIGRSIEELVDAYTESDLTFEAVREAIFLASQALMNVSTAPELVLA